eukprot:CAMPEP_0204403436 /NCGR_PEP_ID=MMETSP0470-20130426/5874_1 /ASSEMBLY_ACC=CAM_ASM_000385 /TAXON_ID=2969 /ORGANISM="Oxyrrhis marina" /LENGTH=76 /DNA_ID=CAMNT_0051398579 /DNA_START=8 /DNA_END=235 /DNA_ORIENTATION=+
MRVIAPALLLGSAAAVKFSRHSEMEGSIDGGLEEEAMQELQDALNAYSDANLDPNMPLDEAVDHVSQRGVPASLVN